MSIDEKNIHTDHKFHEAFLEKFAFLPKIFLNTNVEYITFDSRSYTAYYSFPAIELAIEWNSCSSNQDSGDYFFVATVETYFSSEYEECLKQPLTKDDCENIQATLLKGYVACLKFLKKEEERLQNCLMKVQEEVKKAESNISKYKAYL